MSQRLQDKIIDKVVVGTILGVGGYGLGCAVQCAASGKTLGVECFFDSLSVNIFDDATNLGLQYWLNFSPAGQIAKQTGAYDKVKDAYDNYDYKSVIGHIPDFKCGSDQEEHGGLCYDKSQIPSGYEFSSVGHYIKPCNPGENDTGLTCEPPLKPRSAGFGWQPGDGFNLEGAYQRCNAVYGRGQCEQWGAIIYPACAPLYGPDYESFGCCLCKSKLGLAYEKQGKWITAKVKSQVCPSGESNHDGLCYANPGDEWSYVSPGIYRKPAPPETDDPVTKAKNDLIGSLPKVFGAMGVLIGIYIG